MVSVLPLIQALLAGRGLLTSDAPAEISQQAKARHKEEFLTAYAPFVAEAAAIAYKGAPSDVQQRIRRVIEVWRERQVFDEAIQSAVESRIKGKLVNDERYWNRFR